VIAAVLALNLGIGLPGCSPQPPPHSARLESQLFARVEIIASRGTAPGQLNKPRSVTVDAQDNLYVVDLTARVQKFSPDGQFLLSWQLEETDQGKPKGMGCDHEGQIIVLEPHYSRVNHFSPDGVLRAQWGTYGTNAGELAFPRAVAVNAQGEIFVSEYGLRERVQRFAPRGTNLQQVIGRAGLGDGEFNRAEGLGLDRAGRLYVADSCNHRVQVFAPDGRWLRSYGKPGRGLGQLSYPYDVQVDAAGYQFVCEFGNSRVQVFDAQDRPVEIIGGAGSEPGRFANPWSIALDSRGHLYVADALNHRVQKLVRRAAGQSSNVKAQSSNEVPPSNPKAQTAATRFLNLALGAGGFLGTLRFELGTGSLPGPVARP
jgi:sugar lactone lactonase YvrE